MVWKMIFVIAVIVFVVMLLIGVIDGNRFVVVEEEFELPKLKKKL